MKSGPSVTIIEPHSRRVLTGKRLICLLINLYQKIREKAKNAKQEAIAAYLEAKNIKSFGIMAYGRDFISDLSVSTVEFYY